jgi:hypothetical protein
MYNSSNSNELRNLSLEEQKHEAKQDGTGKIRRYLNLAEKLFHNDYDASPDAA